MMQLFRHPVIGPLIVIWWLALDLHDEIGYGRPLVLLTKALLGAWIVARLLRSKDAQALDFHWREGFVVAAILHFWKQ